MLRAFLAVDVMTEFIDSTAWVSDCQEHDTIPNKQYKIIGHRPVSLHSFHSKKKRRRIFMTDNGSDARGAHNNLLAKSFLLKHGTLGLS